VRQLREAENVLSSYTHAIDLLAEALQNATDAIDARSEQEPGGPRRIEIDFDVPARSFSVTDSGIGMSDGALQKVSFPLGRRHAAQLRPERPAP
jgi:signal transduction histidine kinase